MKKMTLAIVVGTALSLNVAVSGVPVADGATIANGIKQLMEKIQEHKEQTQTWEEEEKRYETENKGLNSEQALKDMNVDKDTIKNLFEKEPFKKVYDNKKPEVLLDAIVKNGVDGFPNDIKNTAKKKYANGFKTDPISREEIAQNQVAVSCSARDASIALLKQFDEASNKLRNDNTNATTKTTGELVKEKGSGSNGGISRGLVGGGADDNSGTASVAAGTTASAVVRGELSSAIQSAISEKRNDLDTVRKSFDEDCSLAMNKYSASGSNVGFSTVINVLSILPTPVTGGSFEPKKDPAGRSLPPDARF